MSKLPVVSGKQAIKIFAKIGYRIIRQRGSHVRLYHNDKRPITIPNHKILAKGLLRKLLRDAELSISDFIKFL